MATVISWATAKSLLILLGPVMLPRAIRFYRSLKDENRRKRQPVRAAPSGALNGIAVLLLTMVAFAVVALPQFGPEDIFTLTQSRIQTPTDVLFTRLQSLRLSLGQALPEGLTAADEALRARLVSVEGRLLYLKFGPDVTADCPFCRSDAPFTFLQYAMPALAIPHLVNLFVIAVATSLAGTRDGRRWRRLATYAAVVLVALDIGLLNAYNHATNARATRLSDVSFFHWRLRTCRFAVLAALDFLLAGLMYLSSTNRLFATPPSAAERVEAIARKLTGAVRPKLSAMGVVKNTALRDEQLRARGEAYWLREVRIMGEIMEGREVIDGVTDALQNRIDIVGVERDAEAYSDRVLQALQVKGEGIARDEAEGRDETPNA